MENRQEELPLSFSVFPERVLVDRWKKFLFYKMEKKKPKNGAASEFLTSP